MHQTPSLTLYSLHLPSPPPLPKPKPPILLVQLRKRPITLVAFASASRPKRRAAAPADGGTSEMQEVVRLILRKSSEEKQPLVATLGKFVKVVRNEHCFLLFEELGKRDKWLQCLEGMIVMLDYRRIDTFPSSSSSPYTRFLKRMEGKSTAHRRN